MSCSSMNNEEGMEHANFDDDDLISGIYAEFGKKGDAETMLFDEEADLVKGVTSTAWSEVGLHLDFDAVGGAHTSALVQASAELSGMQAAPEAATNVTKMASSCSSNGSSSGMIHGQDSVGSGNALGGGGSGGATSSHTAITSGGSLSSMASMAFKDSVGGRIDRGVDNITNMDDDDGARPLGGVDRDSGGFGDDRKRPSVGEYSKWQRQKRKAMINDHVKAAKELTKEIEDLDARNEKTFQEMKRRREAMIEKLEQFLQNWFSTGKLSHTSGDWNCQGDPLLRACGSRFDRGEHSQRALRLFLHPAADVQVRVELRDRFATDGHPA